MASESRSATESIAAAADAAAHIRGLQRRCTSRQLVLSASELGVPPLDKTLEVGDPTILHLCCRSFTALAFLGEQ